jgi:hypothetical protein
MNHRLNNFLHLYLREIGGARYAKSGNVEMFDIVEALRCVRANITTFEMLSSEAATSIPSGAPPNLRRDCRRNTSLRVSCAQKIRL